MQHHLYKPRAADTFWVIDACVVTNPYERMKPIDRREIDELQGLYERMEAWKEVARRLKISMKPFVVGYELKKEV